ncbi:hypothetical protein [Brevibacterium sp. ZH18]|uniref:hypothetical protein n=1 Tax=Brevibacterium sp. ZH18 TaxID=2927784 RepID=UPI001F60F403|nr:hypothetical protein [Brevibacterium sp. ZH18]MCI4012364.1 hypothetical protein [Brevibacterium sp. ZH18]
MIENPMKDTLGFDLNVAIEGLKRALLGLPAEDKAISELKATAPSGEHVKYIKQATLLAALCVTDEQVEAFANRVARGEA